MNSTPDTPASPPPDPGPKRFERSSSERLVGGVCGGLTQYFGVDLTLVRIGMVALALLGGVGLVVYAAALVLVPSDGSIAAGSRSTRDRVVAVAIAVALVIACVVTTGWGLGGVLFPIASLGVAGVAIWWLVSGERPSGRPATVLRRAALGVGLLLGCVALAFGSFLASGFGGGVAVAALVIVAGGALAVSAFVGGARWLVLPALAIALPLAFVSAAGIDLDGGFGEREARPATLAEVKDGYRLGAGELVVDLRDVRLPAGDRRLKVAIGTGHVLVLVDEDVCVASSASVGMGAVEVFDRHGAGVDVDFSDERRAARTTPRLVLDGEVGLGFLEVRHERADRDRRPGPRREPSDERNDACSATTASVGSGATG